MSNKHYNQSTPILMIDLQKKLSKRRRKEAGQKVIGEMRRKAKGAGRY